MGGACVQTCAHVFPETEVWFRSYPAERRVTFHIGPSSNDIVLFLDPADIDRMSAVLAEARQSLQAPVIRTAA
ncbi:hypothetical protein GCM10022251_61890 [Phytohabitans flavus]|uniref:Uncharacterized protein n=1 Tax=Phytohabitans flavus TaxID=1076124 RepID=A0A6F8Y5C0_9ACTN|nr:hypothetical protein [Phytohabitans flavus]BCB81324.1 hypothetical protein Pflav_077340 [Phytohabitans flavus]